MIVLNRDSGYADLIRAYKVILDDNVIGEIRNGQQVVYDVAPGKHRLHLEIDWCRSNIVEFEKNEENVEFECGSNLRGFKLLLGVLYATYLRNSYLWLKRK